MVTSIFVFFKTFRLLTSEKPHFKGLFNVLYFPWIKITKPYRISCFLSFVNCVKTTENRNINFSFVLRSCKDLWLLYNTWRIFLFSFVFPPSLCKLLQIVLCIFKPSQSWPSLFVCPLDFYFPWRNSPQWARDCSLSRLHDHTQTLHTCSLGLLWTSYQPGAETST